MRNANSNRINNIWKKIDRKQKKLAIDAINRSITTKARSGKSIRNGQLEFGALQLFNITEGEYLLFGMNSGGPPVAGR